VHDLTAKGCSYLVVNKRTLSNLPDYGKIIYDGADYQLIQLAN
jgi:hypothetical protein